MNEIPKSPASEESLENRFKAVFPRGIEFDEFVDLFAYVTEQMQGELRYSFEGIGNIGNRFPALKEEPRRREKYLSQIKAILSLPNLDILLFSTQHDKNYLDFARIKGIEFNFPGQDYDEISPQDLGKINIVKSYIEKYFEYTSD